MHSDVIDYRKHEDAGIEFLIKKLQYLNFTRQVLAPSPGESEDFDDSAVQMTIDLGFGLAGGKEPSYSDWIEPPEDIDRGMKVFTETEFVQSLLHLPAVTIGVNVGHCG